MRIAVIEHAGLSDYAAYVFSLIEEKARQYNYQVKAWSNSIPAFQQRVAGNAVIFISIESRSTFGLNWWYKIKIPSILKRTKADVIINLNGIAYRNVKISQLLAAGPHLFNKNVKQLSVTERFAFKNFERSLKTATGILSYSARKRDDYSGIEKEKLHTVHFTAPAAFKTYEWHDKIMIKAQYADNKEYFVAVIEDNDVDGFVMLLQAFSKFKNWQQSNMQLLILPKHELLDDGIIAKHKTYKYRDDVQLLEEIEEKQVASIIASAYAYVHIATVYAHLFMVSIALQCSLPIVSFEDDDVKEYAGNAALYCTEKNAGALGNVLIQLYKDENLLAQLKEAAKNKAANLNRKDFEDKLWQLIENIANT